MDSQMRFMGTLSNPNSLKAKEEASGEKILSPTTQKQKLMLDSRMEST